MNLKINAFALIFLLLPFSGFSQLQIELEEHASGFNNPVDIVHANDDRLFIVEKSGIIRILNADGTTNATPFLNISSLISSSGERGLLGLAFHPDYENNGYFYVHYTNNSSDSRIARYTVSPNPDIALVNSAVIILAQDQPASNHNAGDINFGPDGYLYVPFGDGGGAGDTNNLSQNTQTFLGKMLRIDVDGGEPYAIPSDNPFLGITSTLDEIWSIGLRNPWRFSFDALTGDMWIGDVGQNVWEEIDFEPAGSAGGINYGWRCKEGFANFNTSGCTGLTLTDPVAVYNHTGGACSVTGGFVYRGSEFPSMFGRYFYTDYCDGVFRTLESDGLGGWDEETVSSANGFGWTTFGEDSSNELYVANSDGTIYRIIDPATPVIAELNLTALLQGPYAEGTLLMNDLLRVGGQIPLEEPYTAFGYTHVGGGGESIMTSVLANPGPDAIVDWVFVEVRSGINSSTVLATQSALIQADGDIVATDGVSPLTLNVGTSTMMVHVAIRHRNHLGIRTNTPVSAAAPIILDFSDIDANIFGTEPTSVIDDRNLLYSGDANMDGQVNSIDKNFDWRSQNATTYDYINSTADMNLDGAINSADKNFHWRVNNSRVQQLD